MQLAGGRWDRKTLGGHVWIDYDNGNSVGMGRERGCCTKSSGSFEIRGATLVQRSTSPKCAVGVEGVQMKSGECLGSGSALVQTILSKFYVGEAVAYSSE
jgi:hypothetical protein